MRKIGFIDLFIDEWHANHYPDWFRNAPLAKEFEVGYAWEEAPKPGLRPLEKWCADFNMTPARSIEEVIENSDALCVLAPSNPEVHERLATLPLQSGKPVYLDKPFAPDKATAERIFALAEKHGTPLMSSSSLRFGDELLSGKVQNMHPIMFATTGGGSNFPEYAIHQLEMIVSAMGTDVKDIKLSGDDKKVSLTLFYADGRMAQSIFAPPMPFAMMAANEGEYFFVEDLHNTFPNLIDSMMRFFISGKSPIPKEQTIAIADLLGRSVSLLNSLK